MNYYLYGPKDDPYHSCPNWRLPYPEKEAANIKELVEACNQALADMKADGTLYDLAVKYLSQDVADSLDVFTK